jgi:transcriptional regulator with XRE-family HTH domain
LLGAQLRQLREAKGLTRAAAGYTIRASESKMSRLELGRVSFKERDIRDLLMLYGVEAPDQRDGLLSLAKQANEPGWWHRYSDILPNWFEAYVGLEETATLIRTYEGHLVPGLLQTEDYARAVMLAGAPERIGRGGRAVAQATNGSQALLALSDAPRLWAVVDEAALHREVGGPAVMTEQLEHLLRMGQLPNVKIQILPTNAGAHGSMSGPICVFSFADPAEPDIGWLEHPLGGNIVDDPGDVATMAMLFDDLREAALGVRESTRLISALVNERGGGGEDA